MIFSLNYLWFLNVVLIFNKKETYVSSINIGPHGDEGDCHFIGPCSDKADCSARCASQDYDPHGALCVRYGNALVCCCIIQDSKH